MTEGYQDIQVRNVPRALLAEFDKAIEDEYPTRAEAIRDLMRQYIRQKKARKP